MMNYKFIGWYQKENHDKVWGVIYLEPPEREHYSWHGSGVKCLTFWGRRGAKLQTKLSVDNQDLYKLIDAKRGKGYRELLKSELDDVYPEFEADLEKTAIWVTLLM